MARDLRHHGDLVVHHRRLRGDQDDLAQPKEVALVRPAIERFATSAVRPAQACPSTRHGPPGYAALCDGRHRTGPIATTEPDSALSRRCRWELMS
ncbi:hypothetical protein DMP14_15305 [Pseudonocardia sp. Ae707_Ps2]